MTAPLLDDALRDLNVALADCSPPKRVDKAIASAIARAQRRRARSARSRVAERWLVWPIALAASIAAISFVVRPTAPGEILAVSGEATARERAFLPLASPEDIEQSTDAYVVPARLARPALAQLGLPVDPARIDQPVDAELLVRPDGAVLAFRFVN
jgi:hypothetical protein